ncbi:MAG: beta-galactosidase, partial [Planctomycetota bacterium]
MPTVTYDGRSFMLDGRRIWLVSGSVPIGRISRDSWADRIHSAKQAGLNTIETPVFWNRHEPRQSKLDFTGDNDLRHFVKLVQAAGMYCVLRIGPFVGMGCDMGGLPAWLHDLSNAKLRTANNVYLEACSKFLTAAVEQVRDLQVTSPGRGGPVVAVQVESGWTSGPDTLAHHYQGELNRYVREAGLSVPLL